MTARWERHRGGRQSYWEIVRISSVKIKQTRCFPINLTLYLRPDFQKSPALTSRGGNESEWPRTVWESGYPLSLGGLCWTSLRADVSYFLYFLPTSERKETAKVKKPWVRGWLEGWTRKGLWVTGTKWRKPENSRFLEMRFWFNFRLAWTGYSAV